MQGHAQAERPEFLAIASWNTVARPYRGLPRVCISRCVPSARSCKNTTNCRRRQQSRRRAWLPARSVCLERCPREVPEKCHPLGHRPDRPIARCYCRRSAPRSATLLEAGPPTGPSPGISGRRPERRDASLSLARELDDVPPSWSPGRSVAVGHEGSARSARGGHPLSRLAPSEILDRLPRLTGALVFRDGVQLGF